MFQFWKMKCLSLILAYLSRHSPQNSPIELILNIHLRCSNVETFEIIKYFNPREKRRRLYFSQFMRVKYVRKKPYIKYLS